MCSNAPSLRCGSAHSIPRHTWHLLLLIVAHVTCSNYGLPRRRVTWLQLLSWLTKRTYKIIILTCILVAWERYGALQMLGLVKQACQQDTAVCTYDDAVIAGTCAAIPGAKGTELWVQQGLQVVALVWYFVPRFKLIERAVQAFGLGHRQTSHSDSVRRSWKAKAE